MTPEEETKARPAGQAGQRLAVAESPPIFTWTAIESLIEESLRLPDRPDSRWHRAGIGARGERAFEIASGLVMLLFVVGWTIAIVASYQDDDDAAVFGARRPSVASRLTDALTQEDAPAMAYLTDATLQALTPLRGESGALRARFQPGDTALPVDSVPAGAAVELTAKGDTVRVAGDSAAPPVSRPGIWSVVVRAGNVIKPVADFRVITLVPMSARRNGRVGLYYIGSWPTEKGRRVSARGNYAAPRGFIEVTPQNQDTYVSQHFRLRDFLTHDQQNVWPKYLVLQTPLLDKLELVMAELEQRGIRTRGVRVMSGFRTPQYNRGGGNTAGRAELSRHMYGDASDIYIDDDGNGVMDDLNRDGRVTPADARVILNAVEKVEREHPALVGGAGTYPSGPGHGPFIHIDTRGYRARWTGGPGGG